MSKTYYISDLHLGHKNVIRFDNRPFDSVEEMNETLVNNWNSVVTNADHVYHLGDFCWGKKDEWIEFLKRLNGNIHIIRGNHCLKQFGSDVKKYLAEVADYKEITDEGRHVILCHYPIPFYKADYNPNVYMLYGHAHTTLENDFMEHFKEYIKEHDTRGVSKNQCNLYNVGCMMPWMNYVPKTLDEIIGGANYG